MKDWYLRQTPRDRAIVIGVAVLALAALLYALVWYPLQGATERAERAIATKTETLAFLREAEGRLAGAAGTPERRQSDRAPYLLVDEIARRAGLSPPERLEPNGPDGARVQFSEVPFDTLITVLAELELYGLEVTDMTLSRRNPGTVSARFNMERR